MLILVVSIVLFIESRYIESSVIGNCSSPSKQGNHQRELLCKYKIEGGMLKYNGFGEFVFSATQRITMSKNTVI